MYLNVSQKWDAILKKVQEGIKHLFPIEGKTGKIELIRLEIPNKTNSSIESQKQSLLAGSSLGTPVYGEFRLTKTNGKSETAKIKILDLPILTVVHLLYRVRTIPYLINPVCFLVFIPVGLMIPMLYSPISTYLKA